MKFGFINLPAALSEITCTEPRFSKGMHEIKAKIMNI